MTACALETAGLDMITRNLPTVRGGVDALAVVDALLDGGHGVHDHCRRAPLLGRSAA